MKRLLFLAGLTLFIFFFLHFEVLFNAFSLKDLLTGILYVFLCGIALLIVPQICVYIYEFLCFLFNWLSSPDRLLQIPFLKNSNMILAFLPRPPKYSAALTEEIIHRFKSGETLEAIAADAGKTPQSIRGKLVSEGIYGQYKDINLRLSLMEQTEREPLMLSNGVEHPLEDVAQYLIDVGYMRVSQVTEEGCYSIAGGTVVVFPYGAAKPAVLDYFGDTIETIRNKNSKTTLPSITIPPLSGPVVEED